MLSSFLASHSHSASQSSIDRTRLSKARPNVTPILTASSRAWNWLLYQCITMFYFTKSDFKTTVFPIALFATAAAPVSSTTHLLESTLWIWVHLLHFNVANQSIGDSPQEDKLNKPDRPIPSGRITVQHARILRWALAPICILYSALVYTREVAAASIAMSLLIIVYNEFGAHTGQWFRRNCINALGLGCFELGASLIAGNNRHSLDKTGILSVIISVGILSTTYQTADFKDLEGDRLIGRLTLPIINPRIARPSVLVTLSIWTSLVALVWEFNRLDVVGLVGLVFCATGFYTAWRFVAFEGRRPDQVSFYWYNLWLTLVHLLPGIWRLTSL